MIISLLNYQEGLSQKMMKTLLKKEKKKGYINRKFLMIQNIKQQKSDTKYYTELQNSE